MLMLKDILREVKDSLPNAAAWRSWGPSYCRYTEGKVTYHDLSFELYRNSYTKGPRIYCALHFPHKKNGRVYWGVSIKRQDHSDYDKKLYTYKPAIAFCKKKLLEKDLILKETIGCLNRWRIMK